MTLVLNNLGLVQFKSGRLDDARSSYDRALTLARYRGDLLSEGVIEENNAELELSRGDLCAASESIARALEIAILRQDPLRRASALKLLGVSLRLSGRAQESLDPLRGALAICANADDALLEAEVLVETGSALADTGDRGAARESLESALQVYKRIGATKQALRVEEIVANFAQPS
jgi:tetratricopeptide (TPR) repeat protein